MTYTSLAKRPNGQIVRVWCDESVNVYFDGVAVPMPERGLFVWAAASDTRVGAIVQGHDPANVRMARVVFDDKITLDLGPSNGIQCVAMRYADAGVFVGRFTTQDTKHEGIWVQGDPLEYAELPEDVIGTSQGYLDYQNGQPIFTDRVPRPDHRFGFPIWQPQTRGPWTIFQCVFRDTGDGIGARHDDGRVFRVSSLSSQIAPKVEIGPDGQPIAAISHNAPLDALFVPFDRWQEVSPELLKPATPGQPPIVPPPPAPADCTAERAEIARLNELLGKSPTWQEWAAWWQFVFDSGGQHPYADVGGLRASITRAWGSVEKRAEQAEAERDARLTPDQVLKLVNDATGKMAGYWRYLGVQGAVDRAVKAELAKRKT
jgi:hypothetical protein